MTIPRKDIREHLEMHGFTDFIILAIRRYPNPADEVYPGHVEVFSTLTDSDLTDTIIAESSGTTKANWIKPSELSH